MAKAKQVGDPHFLQFEPGSSLKICIPVRAIWQLLDNAGLSARPVFMDDP
jgi:hypothetical protein